MFFFLQKTVSFFFKSLKAWLKPNLIWFKPVFFLESINKEPHLNLNVIIIPCNFCGKRSWHPAYEDYELWQRPPLVSEYWLGSELELCPWSEPSPVRIHQFVFELTSRVWRVPRWQCTRLVNSGVRVQISEFAGYQFRGIPEVFFI